MVYCSKCELYVAGGLRGIREHVKEERHVGPFFCKEGHCSQSKLYFASKPSWMRHLQHKHPESCEDRQQASSGSSSSSSGDELPVNLNVEAPPDLEDSDPPDDPDEGNEELQDDLFPSLEKAAALLLLRLKRRANVPGAAVGFVIKEVAKLMEDVISVVTSQISTKLVQQNVDKNVIELCVKSIQFCDPFVNLQTQDQQLDYFKNHFGMVEPTSVHLESRWDERMDKQTGMIMPVQTKVSFEYISIIKILTAVLNNSVLFKLIHNEKQSSDGHLRSFLDGSLAKCHPLISKYPFTIRVNKWMDDSEVVNPLGSKCSIHKIVTDAFTIQNLPPSENARLRSIFVSSYSYREDLPEQRSVDALLEPFFYEMEQLESEDGVVISVQGQPYTLRATLVSFSADSLAAHELVGLGSPSCRRFCSQCLITRQEFHHDIFAMGLLRTKEVHLENVEELKTRGQEFAMRSSGLKREALLVTKPKYASFPEAIIKDPMHDILRGIAPMEIKLVLHEFCIVRKYFDVESFNAALKSFNYGPADSKNKPSPNFTQESLKKISSYVLHQTASQAWCLLRIFPFLVASQVPNNCPHLDLVVLLKRICDIVFSTDVTEDDLNQLDELIRDHHRLFITLYPPQPDHDPFTEEVEVEDFLEEEERVVEDPVATSCSQPTAPADMATRKKKRVVRPLQKHHHLLHYTSLMKKYGPIAQYWCMRFEAKNALTKRFGAICNNFKYLPGTFAKLHQLTQAADWMDLLCPVEDEKSFPRGKPRIAYTVAAFQALSELNVKDEDVLIDVPQATVGGFKYKVGLNVALPFVIRNLPVFGRIKHIYIFNNQVFIITQDLKTVQYSLKFAAYMIEDCECEVVRAFQSSKLPPVPPMTQWTADNTSFYLSPRNALADVVLSMGRAVD